MLLKWNWCRKFRCTLPLRYIALKQIMEKGSKKLHFLTRVRVVLKDLFFVPNSSSDISSGLHKSDFRFQTVASFSSLKSSCSDDGESSFEASVSWIYLPSFSNPLLRWIAEKKKKTKKRKTNELFFFLGTQSSCYSDFIYRFHLAHEMTMELSGKHEWAT